MNRVRTRHALLGVLLMSLVVSSPTQAVKEGPNDDCLVSFLGAADGDTIQQGATNGVCTFNVDVCANRPAGTCTGTTLKPVKVKGKCHAAALKFAPTGDTPQCGPSAALTVKLKGHGHKAGMCKLVAMAKSATSPKRVDKDVLTLVCNPNAAPGGCPTLPTTCTPAPNATCMPLVNDGQGIPGTYQMLAVPGPKLCQTNTPNSAKRFQPCNSEADCGGQEGTTQFCTITTFATADGVVLPFGSGIKTVFTIAQDDPPPTCNHSACITCENPDAPCAGYPGCAAAPGTCIRDTCCQNPGFTLPTFLVPLLGGLCGRLDQYRCGFGVVNSSNPQSGDNEVTKIGDTSDPGPDCEYGTADDPPAKVCNTSNTGAGHDLKGKVVRCVGDGVCDSAGIHYRMAVPSVATTWQDLQSPPGQCTQGSTFDPGEFLITQVILNAEFTTAGSTSSFADLNGDGCAVAGAGFTNLNKTGPFTLGSPPAKPQPYDSSTCGNGVCSVGVSGGPVFSGGSPLFDLGFVAVFTNGAMTRMPTQSCPCTQVQGCPE
jgi:hypothetical protein